LLCNFGSRRVSIDDAPQVSIRNSGEPLVLKASAGLTILLRYGDGVELRIPVQNDAIQTNGADLSKGYSLRVENGQTRIGAAHSRGSYYASARIALG